MDRHRSPPPFRQTELPVSELAGNQAEWAKNNGVTRAYVSAVLNGEREPGEAILKALKIERVTVYRKIK